MVDLERADARLRRPGPAQEISGGSCANTMVGLASFGGSVAFIGRVRDDQLGTVFAHDIRAAGRALRRHAGDRRPGDAAAASSS